MSSASFSKPAAGWPTKRIEKELRSRIQMLPAQLHLPSKKDIDGLARRVGRLHKKVDALQRAVAA